MSSTHVARFAARGIVLLRTAPDQITVYALLGVCTRADLRAVASVKSALLEELQGYACRRCASKRYVFSSPGVTCYWCRYAGRKGSHAAC